MLIFGRGRREGAIHRCVWAPGIKSQSEAILYVNRLIGDAIIPLILEHDRNINVLDLGCGVGGTAVWLARLFDLKVTGITISRIQADLARKNALKRGVEDRCAFIHGDFLNLSDIGDIDAAFAIESFSHARNPYLGIMFLSTRLPFKIPYKESLYGGTALQICLKRGWVEYHFLIFEKS
jgi:SAM-dependent methyltransferase